MGIRSNVELTVELGQDNKLDNLIFSRSFQELLDSLEHASSQLITLAASETNYVVPFGDVLQARLIYIEADGDINVTVGGGLATKASMDASGAIYPTGFVGAETLLFSIDGTAITVTFLVADQTLAQVVNRINAAAALLGIAPVAFDNGSGQLRLTSPTTGTSSTVAVTGGTGRVTLGLSITTATGANSTPGTSPMQLRKPIAQDGSTQASGVDVVFLATVQTTSLVLANPSTTEARVVRIGIAGDLTTLSC